MAYSNIEPNVYGVAVWLAQYLPTYLTAANAEQTSWPGDMVFPSIFLVPDEDYNPPALRRAAVGSSIPMEGPFPYLMVELDSVDVEWAGQNSEFITLRLRVIIALQETREKKLLAALTRYMDALVQAVGHNVTLGGLLEEAKVTHIEKDELPANHVGFVTADMTAKFEILCE